jgi:hypothetical protein
MGNNFTLKKAPVTKLSKLYLDPRLLSQETESVQVAATLFRI